MFDDEIASAPPRKVARASSTMSAVAGVSLTQTGTRATAFTAWVDDRAEHRILADVRAHVHAVHVRAGEVQLDRVDAGILDRLA